MTRSEMLSLQGYQCQGNYEIRQRANVQPLRRMKMKKVILEIRKKQIIWRFLLQKTGKYCISEEKTNRTWESIRFNKPRIEEEDGTEETDDFKPPESKIFKPPSCETNSTYTWRIDLTRTEQFWRGWFEGLSSKFLSVPCAKLLLLAGVDRLDRDLTVGQMQGKFQMQVLPQVNRDDPEEKKLE